MPMMTEKSADQSKAFSMLEQFLPDGSTIYHSCVGRTGSTTYSYRRVFTTIDSADKVDSTDKVVWIVNLNLYIANLLGMRRDKWGNILTRLTPSEIATLLSQKLGRTIKDWGI